MSATIRLFKYQATIRDYKWESDNTAFALFLNSLLDPLGPSGADPNPDYNAALNAAEILGAEVISFDEIESEEGIIY